MKPHLTLGRVLGIDIGIHVSWLLIALLIAVSLANRFGLQHPDWSPGLVWATALITGMLFFAGIVVHELAHAVVAKAGGMPVESITLFALGGVASIQRESASAKIEFWMGIAGPIASVALGGACLGAAAALGWPLWSEPQSPTTAVLVWLGYINLALAAFNMLPGFPLDGGRVLRAAVWKATGDLDRSTRIAARSGQVLAALFIGFGLWAFFAAGAFGGLWLALIGWFLMGAAGTAYAGVDLADQLRGLRVRDIMAPECATVSGQEPIEQFVEDHMLRRGERCAIVSDNGRPVGILTPADVRRVDRAEWATTPVRGAMRPIEHVKTVSPETSVLDALNEMGRGDLNQLPVTSNGRVDGIISRGHILRVLQTRAELEI